MKKKKFLYNRTVPQREIYRESRRLLKGSTMKFERTQKHSCDSPQNTTLPNKDKKRSTSKQNGVTRIVKLLRREILLPEKGENSSEELHRTANIYIVLELLDHEIGGVSIERYWITVFRTHEKCFQVYRKFSLIDVNNFTEQSYLVEIDILSYSI